MFGRWLGLTLMAAFLVMRRATAFLQHGSGGGAVRVGQLSSFCRVLWTGAELKPWCLSQALRRPITSSKRARSSMVEMLGDRPILYVYSHCPFCVRVMFLVGFFERPP
jgi:hypothetical protein